MERLGRFRVLVSAIVLCSACRCYDRLAWSHPRLICLVIVVDYQVKRWPCGQSARVCDALLGVDLLAYQLPPRRLSGLAGQEFNGGLALALATLVAPMIMVKHDQI